MLLAIDIGNTNIVFGCVNEKNNIVLFERISTNHQATATEYASLMKNILEMNNFQTTDIDDAIMSSVVPAVTETVSSAVKKLFGIEVMTVGPGLKTGLNILIDNPAQLGSDQVVDAVASINQYPIPQIIIDMGTATTVSAIDKNKNYLGGHPGSGSYRDGGGIPPAPQSECADEQEPARILPARADEGH